MKKYQVDNGNPSIYETDVLDLCHNAVLFQGW